MTARQSRENGGDPRERLLRRGREMRDEGVALADAVRGAANDLVELSRAQLERNLYVTLGSAFALGYVLGGGLPLRLVTTAGRMGVMAALDAALKQRLTTPAGNGGAEHAAD
jgi:hypothetical protein